jgi:hypothetical protein
MSSSTACPSCSNPYRDIQDHIRKIHPNESYTVATIASLGLVPCLICLRPFHSRNGVLTHARKAHGEGTGPTVTGMPASLASTSLARSRLASNTSTARPSLASASRLARPSLASDTRLASTPPPRPVPSFSLLVSPSDSPRSSSPPTSPLARAILPLPRRSPRLARTLAPPPPPPLSSIAPRNQARSSISTSEETLYRRKRTRDSSLSPSISISRSKRVCEDTIRSERARKNNEEAPQTAHPRSINLDLDPPSPTTSSPSSSASLPSLSRLTSPSWLASSARPASPPRLASPTRPTRPSRLARSPRLASNARLGSTSGRNSPPLSSPTHSSIADSLLESSPWLAKLVEYKDIKVVEKPLHSRHAGLFIEASTRIVASYLAHPTEQNLFYFLLLPKVLAIGLNNKENRNLGATLRAYPSVIPIASPIDNDLELDRDLPRSYLDEEKALELAITRASSLVDRGLIGRASRTIVNPSTIAKSSNKTLKALEEKHPIEAIGRRFRARTKPPSTRPIVDKDILAAISSFSTDTASGLDGWTIPLLKLVIEKGRGLEFLRALANQTSKGLTKGSSLLLASRLIPIDKKEDGGIRPIAVGSLVYRLTIKAILGTFSSEDALLPCQLGVGTKLGVEPAITLLADSLEGDRYNSITSLDLLNAFNSLGRSLLASAIASYAPSLYRLAKWAYNDPSILATRSGLLVSSSGVRQGDPLGPLFFSLAIRPFLEDLAKKLPSGSTIISYIDDIYILSNSEDSSILDIAEETLQEYGLVLNRRKSFTTAISTISTSSSGLEVLGSIIGSLEARRAFLTRKIAKFRSILDRLKLLSKQKGLLLLRGSIYLLLRHLLRTLDPRGLEDLLAEIDDLIFNYIRYLRGLEEERELDRDIIALPTRNGGLGIPLFLEASLDTYTTSIRLSREFLASRGYNRQPDPPDPPLDPPLPPSLREVIASYTTRRLERLDSITSLYKKRALLENASYLGRKWLDILPISKNLTIADIELEAALRTRFLVATLAPSDSLASQPSQPSEPSLASRPSRPSLASLANASTCNSCNTTPVTLLNHQDTCKGAARRWILRHNAIRDALAKSLDSSSNTIATRLEPTIEGLSIRPDLVIATANDRIYYDIKVVAINADSAETDPYSTLKLAEQAKIAKFSRLGPSFRPLVFSPGGLLAKETSLEYKRLQRLLPPSGVNYLDSTISLVLLRARARARNSLEV